MGTLFSALDIARSGLQVAQVQLDVAGNNIANVNKEGYSRQRVELAWRTPNNTPFGQMGRGVQIQRIARLRDAFLDAAYRRVAPGLSASQSLARNYSLIEDIFLEPSENGFGNQINTFFNAINSLSNNVQSLPLRQAVVSNAVTLAASFNTISDRLYRQRSSINDEVLGMVTEINSMTQRIGELNGMIRNTEVGGSEASDLRDERDRLLDQLSGFFSISVVETGNGSVDVYVGGDSLVDSTGGRRIEAVRNPALDPVRQDLYELQFADTHKRVNAVDGTLGAAYAMRDVIIPSVSDQADQIARAVIFEVNKIQSQGRGMRNLTGMLTGGNAVSGGAVSLGSAGLPFSIVNGSFDVIVYDASNTPTTTTIAVDPATTTLDSLAAALNAIPNFSASVSDNRLQLGANAGYAYRFANDTSGALAAIGVNALFTGSDAASIGVDGVIAADVSLLSTGYDVDVSNTGDNAAALAMAAVQNALVFHGNTASITDFYQGMIGRIGIDGNANNERLAVEEAFVRNFQNRRQQISGVSLDEEVTQLMLFQRAFEGAARVITVADRMLDSLMAMAR
ncbi:MAG TPA: flagellar hook-associated protein FlgK [Candidatus Hydrogenedentes bacterium]|nr:flagellar hook-associated protein FlgK [Candidatus Hydrogenedentota bacterium]